MDASVPVFTDSLRTLTNTLQSAKLTIVKYLYDRSKRLISKPLVISQEKKNLYSIFDSNGIRIRL